MDKRFTNLPSGSQQGFGDTRKGAESKASSPVAKALLRATEGFVHIKNIEPSSALKRILYGK